MSNLKKLRKKIEEKKKRNNGFTWEREREEDNSKTPTLLLFLSIIEGMCMVGIIKLPCIFHNPKHQLRIFVFSLSLFLDP